MVALARRLLVKLLGNLITQKMVREMIDVAFRFGHMTAKATPTSIDDLAIDALERNVDKDALAAMFAAWLNDRIAR